MRFPRSLTLAPLLAASLLLVTGCASRERVTPIYPPSADLAVEAKPVMPPEAVRSEAVGIAHDIAVEGWGERGWATVGRLCRWAADNGMKGLSCPPPPELPPRPG